MWRYLWLCPAYLLSTSIPLLSIVGRNFEYEYVLISSILLLFIPPIVALLTPNYLIPAKEGVYTPYVKLDFFWILFLGPIIALLPAFFGFTVVKCPCSKSGFIFWMLIQWYPIWIFSHAIYHAIFKFRCVGYSRTRISIALVVLYVLLSLLVAVTLWFNPQKRILSLVTGFIHGPVYDNWIPVDNGIFIGQLAHLFLSLSLLFAALLRTFTKKSKIVISSLLVVWFALALWASFYSSIGSGQSQLHKLLNNVIEHENFELRFNDKDGVESSTGLIRPKKYIRNMFKEAEFHVKELKEIFGEEKLPYVYIYVYPDLTSKKLWFGGGATDVADVYTPSIHIRAEKNTIHRTLRHELVHALSSGFAYHGLGFHPNMAFTEGLAVALAPEESSISLDQGVASLIERKKLPKLKNLFSPMFWKEAGPRAYIVAGSIISYIYNVYGFETVKNLYKGKSVDEVFTKPYIEALKDWRQHVLNNNKDEEDDLVSEALLRSSGLFKSLCPHTKADYRQPKSDSIYTRVRQPFKLWKEDAAYWTWRIGLDPKDRGSQLRLFLEKAKILVDERIVDHNKISLLISEVKEAQKSSVKNIEDVELAILESDLYRVIQDKENSVRILTNLNEEAQKLKVGSNLLRQIESRLKIERALRERDILNWRKYLAGWSKAIPEKSSKVEPWLLTYLRLLRGEQKMFDNDFLIFLLEKIQPTPGLASTFSVMWYKYLGLRLLDKGEYKHAEQAFIKAADAESVTNSRDLYLEYSRLAKFYQLSKN